VDYLTRFVTVTFYPSAPGISMTLGPVEVLGTLLLGNVPGEAQPGRQAPPKANQGVGQLVPTSGDPFTDLLLAGGPTLAANGPPGASTWGVSTAVQPAPAVVDAWDPFGVVSLPAASRTEPAGTGMPAVASSSNPFASWDPFSAPQPASSSPISDPFAELAPQTQNLQTPVPNANGNGASFSQGPVLGAAGSSASASGGQFGVPFATPLKGNKAPLTPVSGGPAAVDAYLQLVRKIVGNEQSVRFSDSMELDIARLRLGLSAAQRDRALLSIGRDPASVDPNRTLAASDVAPLRLAANQLSALTRVAQEDQEIAAAADEGLGIVTREGSAKPSFDNDLVKLQGCVHSECDIGRGGVAGGSAAGGLIQGQNAPLKVCEECQKKACVACLAGTGSGLLKKYRESKVRVESPEAREGGAKAEPKGPPLQDQTLCKKCCPPLVRDAVLVERVRKLSGARRRSRLQAEAAQAGAHLHSFSAGSATECEAGMGNLRDGMGVAIGGAPNLAGESLAEYPYAGLLFLVRAPSITLDWIEIGSAVDVSQAADDEHNAV
jgi:hypothetical protein